MEYLEGEPLSTWLERRIDHDRAIAVLGECAEALSYTHACGIVHGDLKPANIFIAKRGEVRLIDFGSVPDASEFLEVEAGTPDTQNHFAATPAYASPQLLAGLRPEPRDDVFSLGCIAYQLLASGQHPFGGQSTAVAREQNLRPAYIPVIRSREFDVIVQALSWEPSSRQSDVQSFMRALLARDFVRGSERAVVASPRAMVTALASNVETSAEVESATPLPALAAVPAPLSTLRSIVTPAVVSADRAGIKSVRPATSWWPDVLQSTHRLWAAVRAMAVQSSDVLRTRFIAVAGALTAVVWRRRTHVAPRA